MRRFLFFAVALVAVVAAAPAAAGGPWDPLAGAGPQRVTIHILPAVYGREVVPDPNVAVIPGVPVTVTLVNTSRQFHTFTIPRLHVNVVARPGRTSVTFTAPATGVYRWYCELCPALHHKGGMDGHIYALVGG